MRITYHMNAEAFSAFLAVQPFAPEEYYNRLTEQQREQIRAHGVAITLHRTEHGRIIRVDTATDTEPPEHLTSDNGDHWRTATAHNHAHGFTVET
jgi:hypothetical protein